jgi:hypothetical protein
MNDRSIRISEFPDKDFAIPFSHLRRSHGNEDHVHVTREEAHELLDSLAAIVGRDPRADPLVTEIAEVAGRARERWGRGMQMIALGGEAGELGAYARDEREDAALSEVADVLLVALSLWPLDAILVRARSKSAKLRLKLETPRTREIIGEAGGKEGTNKPKPDKGGKGGKKK